MQRAVSEFLQSREETSVRSRAWTKSVHALRQQCLLLAGIMCVLSVASVQAQSIQYFYDDLGRLITVVDPTGNVAEYVYDAVGNILEIRRSTITGLALLNVTPSRGAAGTTVTLQGQGFRSVASENTVTFNGTTATVASATLTSLVVTVPANATTGPIAVTVADETATSGRAFTVLPGITGLRPRIAVPDITITNFQVQGNNLTGATFTFASQPVPPLLTVTSASINAAGNGWRRWAAPP